MRYAIFSDIHGNLPAWEQVLNDIQNSNVDVLVCLGDVVGYGPKPQEVLDGIRAVTDHFVLGNHDAAAAGIIDPTIFNDHAHEVVLWTRDALNEESVQFLNEMPLELETPDLLFVHAEVPDPGRFGYIRDEVDAGASFAAKKHFVTFVGHTHYPECFERLITGAVRKLGDQDRVLDSRHRYIINVGSVGEPRSADDIRARYVIYDDATREVSFRRIEFDTNVYREQLAETTLTHLPYFIRVLEDQAASVAEVQDMQVLDEAISAGATSRRTLLVPESPKEVMTYKPELASIAKKEPSMGKMLVAVLTSMALIGGILYWVLLGGADENPELVEKVEEEKEGEVFASRRDDFVKPENHAPVHKVEGTSEIPKMVKLPKPVFHLDASRPRTWQSLMSRQKGKRPTLNKHGAGNLRVLSFDGRDDMIHSKPVLRSRDDSFTYIALFKPLSVGKAQTLCEQSGKGVGARACLQLVKDGFYFNGNDNDSSRLGTIQQARWQLIAMVLNGKPTDNVIAIHNGSAPVITSIDMSKLKLGDEGFRIGNKLLNDSQQYRGHIAEIEVYNKALSSAQLEERLTTLQKKWGLKFKLQIPEMEAVQ